ncbi:MAG: type II toxin-antitoxin system VapC family toxin, partial [Thermoanaerobaculia bacterium]|nr:type II toxin-antitoxin system VapC family toxin [Thermoanaerobaculia bacterium]
MRYWDASALVPLVVAEDSSKRVRALLRDDPAIVTWAWTRIEIVSAIERRAREGTLSREMRRECLSRFEAFAEHWDEIVDLLAVRTRAMTILARQEVRAADAAQLAAAMLLAEDDPSSIELV